MGHHQEILRQLIEDELRKSIASMPLHRMNELSKLQKQITSCKKCSRLVGYLSEIRKKYPSYWCKPVPSFGDLSAEILIVGLAPGRFGSNRTGRMFTGDASGEFLYRTLYEVGLCDNPLLKGLPWQSPTAQNDGLVLNNCYITAVARCVPPQNKPTPKELENCFPYFEEELKLLNNIRVVVALGKIAFDRYLKWAIRHCEKQLCCDEAISKRYKIASSVQNVPPRNDVLRKKDFQFSHGVIYEKGLPHILIASYHPSRQNTQTGKLTETMFRKIFELAKKRC